MRIALVSEHASPLATLGGVDAGGQNVHVAALAGELAARGHDVSVYTRRDDADLPERVTMPGGVVVVHVPAGPADHVPKDDLLPWMADFGRWLAADWERHGIPDVVHAHFWMSGLAALQAARAMPRPVPVVQTFHALGSVKRRHQGAADTSPSGRVETEATLGRSVDLVIATCTDEVAELRRLGIPAERVTVVPCGVDRDRFLPADPRHGRRVDPADADGAAAARFRLLCLGRLVERKGVGTAVEALAALPDAELVIAGGPSAEEVDQDPEARRLAALADELGVRDRVRFVGSVARDEVPALIRSADVVVATPWYEPFGIVPLEAAACGRPLVGSAVGGLLDSVQHGVTGLLVPPRDPGALAQAVRGLLDDPAARQRMGAAARRRVVELFGWDCVARDTETAYRSLVEARGGHHGSGADRRRAGRRTDRQRDDMVGVRAV
ncbi:glycosyltransferase [Actinotalea sp. Marseille-Q4924]|uniref:glycosyltransferase n=1 Tax=Actinotalea sp. Marseille-Q4924 TaxID=2866571 RepID=UPI001CE46881|nr:glycosyltransferase [Actinotalea sp. Marseille-Q4924]